MISRWSRSDALSASSLIIGVIGLIIVVMEVIPSVLPAVAIVTDISYSQMKGLATATTTFRNTSYDTAINHLEARWVLDRPDINASVDSVVLRYAIESDGSTRRTLKALKPMPAQAEFRAIFNSLHPFQVFDFDVKASQLVVGPSGAVVAEVPMMEEKDYDRLLARRYVVAVVALAGYVVAYVLLITVTKRIFLGHDLKQKEEVRNA